MTRLTIDVVAVFLFGMAEAEPLSVGTGIAIIALGFYIGGRLAHLNALERRVTS